MDRKHIISAENLSKQLETHSKIVLAIFIAFIWLASLLMFCIIGLGMFKIFTGLITELNVHKPEEHGIVEILEGLEFIFVSPLCYLMLLSMSKYVFATRPEVNPSLEEKKMYVTNSVAEILNVKTFTTGLFISILFLHAIRIILDDAVNLKALIYLSSIIVLLISYYFTLDLILGKLRRSSE